MKSYIVKWLDESELQPVVGGGVKKVKRTHSRKKA